MKWIILATVVAAATAVQFHACPTNVKKAIDKCMGLVSGSGSGNNMYGLMTDLQNTLQYCREDALASLFDCMNQLYNTCARKKANAAKLGLVMQAKQWESAISLLCENRGYLQNNMQCDAHAMPPFKACLARETAELKNKVEALENNQELSQAQKIEAGLNIACLTHSKIQDCLRKPFEKHCSPHVTNLLLDVLGKFMPPVCAQREPVTSTTPSPVHGPAYDSSRGDHHQDQFGANSRDSIREDLVISIPGRSDNIGGDVDGDDDDDRDFFELHGDRAGSRDDREDDRRENLFQGPGAAAQAKESDSDKDGATGVHSVSVKVAMVLAVVLSTLAVTAGGLV